uniref:Uncharacterized protein n=1 Tax=Leersia perrieri TaxID=77586 RepID=A0A0D9V0L8_9ORYZ
MKNRVQAFTEGIVLMVCPVLLAVAFKKADLKSNGKGKLVGVSISPLAAITLEAGLLPFLCLIVSDNHPPADGRLASLLFRASKLLVHLCGLLLMALSYILLLLIDMDKHLYFLAGLVLAPLVPITILRCYRSTRNGGEYDAAGIGYDEGALEKSVDFSVAVTTLLFLGLEGLALEGQNNGACHGRLERLFTASLGITYLACELGVFIMLRGTVPPQMNIQDDSTKICNDVVELLNVVLAVAIALVVVLIAAAQLREQAWLVFVPLILSFVVWMYRVLVGADGGREHAPGRAKQPASLELTKVTFTGFLAVAVPTFSNTAAGISIRGFVLLSAAAVISGLGWRLLTHRIATPSPAMVGAASVASFFAHLCVAAAVIPFSILAVSANSM